MLRLSLLQWAALLLLGARFSTQPSLPLSAKQQRPVVCFASAQEDGLARWLLPEAQPLGLAASVSNDASPGLRLTAAGGPSERRLMCVSTRALKLSA